MVRRACPHIPTGPTTRPYAPRPDGTRSPSQPRARRRPGRDRSPSDAAALCAPPTSPVRGSRIWGTVPHAESRHICDPGLVAESAAHATPPTAPPGPPDGTRLEEEPAPGRSERSAQAQDLTRTASMELCAACGRAPVAAAFPDRWECRPAVGHRRAVPEGPVRARRAPCDQMLGRTLGRTTVSESRVQAETDAEHPDAARRASTAMSLRPRALWTDLRAPQWAHRERPARPGCPPADAQARDLVGAFDRLITLHQDPSCRGPHQRRRRKDDRSPRRVFSPMVRASPRSSWNGIGRSEGRIAERVPRLPSPLKCPGHVQYDGPCQLIDGVAGEKGFRARSKTGR